MAKTKDIHLRHHSGDSYEVIKLTNSTDYNPRQAMNRREVNELCKRRDWKVHIT